MKVYIIATNESRQFVTKITPALKGAGVISSLHDPLDISDNFGQLTKERIKEADIVLIIVDEHFAKNANVKTEMQMALAFSSHSNRSVLFPIILDDNQIPEDLNSIMCARCHSDSDADIQRLSVQLQKAVANKRETSPASEMKSKKSQSKPFEKYSTVAAFITGIMTVFAAVISIVFEKTTLATVFGNEFTITIITVLIAVATTMGIATYTTMMKRRKSVEEKEEVEQYSKKIKEAIAPKESKVNIDCLYGDVHIHQTEEEINEENGKTNVPEIDALGLMRINLEDIKEFYTWSQKQAKGSFRLAVAMCIGGFALMVAAIILPIVFGLNIEMAIIPAIGGAIAELVAGTALFVYRSSLSQLNHYHKALHEDERFLSSVNLLSRFSTTEAQDEMLKEIIRSEIQMNLISIALKEDSTTVSKDEKKSNVESQKNKGDN